ncbi:ABC transporter permease [Candidatus Micrarchaeota archaeon]|nr:ABC transporter permease [Candidatus Micrarchaeota archaeon]
MLLDKFEYAVKTLTHHYLRTFLTVLGVIVGVSAILLLLSISLGLNDTIERELDKFGANNGIILPISQSSLSSSFGPSGTRISSKLYITDIQKVRSVSGVESAVGVISLTSTLVQYRSEEFRLSGVGIDPYVLKTYYPNIAIKEGRLLQNSDSKHVVIGYNVAKKVFNRNIEVGSTIKINDQSFTVVGILEKSGGQAGSDNNIFIKYDEARAISSLDKNQVSAIYFVIQDSFDILTVQSKVETALRNAHGVKKGEEDFTVITAESTKESVQNILGYLTLFLGAVSGISLVVGGLGIMNSMYMSITERTYEIGVLKSIGVKKNDILQLFLIESGLIGLIGGIIAVVFSIILVIIGNVFLEGSLKLLLTMELAIGGLLFSFILGIISGYIPAKQASDLDVLDALGRK